MTKAKGVGRGGPRVPAGGRPRKKNRQRLELKPKTAKNLYWLTKYRRSHFDKPDLIEEDVVDALVEAECERVLEFYDKAAEEAQEPYIL